MANFENFSNPYIPCSLNNLKRICKSIMHMPIHMSIFFVLIYASIFFLVWEFFLCPEPFFAFGNNTLILLRRTCLLLFLTYRKAYREEKLSGDYNEVSHCYLLLFLIHHGVVTMLDLVLWIYYRIHIWRNTFKLTHLNV
jgi:hypothetical protein